VSRRFGVGSRGGSELSSHRKRTPCSMSGFLQTCFYFGYMGLFCAAIAVLCGSVGYAAASTFVTRIYRNIKVD
jgi:hypothetical protein